MDVAQLVRASDCDSEGRGFESRLPPQIWFDGRGKISLTPCPLPQAGEGSDRCAGAQQRYLIKAGPLAQLVEQETLNLLVLGSSPRRPTTFSRLP